jgi:hypothetical protein
LARNFDQCITSAGPFWEEQEYQLRIMRVKSLLEIGSQFVGGLLLVHCL